MEKALIDWRLHVPDDVGTMQVEDDPVRVSAANSPHAALFLAVLDNGVTQYRRYAGMETRRGMRLFQEAEDWIMDNDYTWPCSFVNICLTLGIDPERFRQDLAKEKEYLLRGVVRFSKRRRGPVNHSARLSLAS